ncbi:MAG: heme-dependent oxidative N-demethylase subunit alpha family protein [Opitutus sp.]
MNSLLELFPDRDFRLHLTLRKGEPSEFFQAADASGRLQEERRRWLTTDPEKYSALRPAAVPLFCEFLECCAAWKLMNVPPIEATDVGLREIGALLEPDLLFVSPDQAGEFRLEGGVLCFPTGWALRERLSHALDSIHGVVPGLNPTLGVQISQFLSRLKPGVAFHRDNWGIVASDELNYHPSRGLPPPVLPVQLSSLWLRVEHQAFMALPKSGGVVFGIRISRHRLDECARQPGVAAGLARELETMPVPMAVYKRLDAVRHSLVAALRAS